MNDHSGERMRHQHEVNPGLAQPLQECPEIHAGVERLRLGFDNEIEIALEACHTPRPGSEQGKGADSMEWGEASRFRKERFAPLRVC